MVDVKVYKTVKCCPVCGSSSFYRRRLRGYYACERCGAHTSGYALKQIEVHRLPVPKHLLVKTL